MFYIKKYYRKIIVILIPFIIIILMIINLLNKQEKSENDINNELLIKEENITLTSDIINTTNTKKINIKGAVVNPGVYEFTDGERVIDQTCSIMIQRLRTIFQRNPLISMGI